MRHERRTLHLHTVYRHSMCEGSSVGDEDLHSEVAGGAQALPMLPLFRHAIP